MRRLRVFCVINGMLPGGAERMFGRLLTRFDLSHFDLRAASLLGHGEVSRQLQDYGIPVSALQMTRYRVPNPAVVLKLSRLMRKHRPDVVQTWMYQSNVFGGLAARLAGNLPVVWNIRHSTLDPRIDSRNLRWAARLGGVLSEWLPSRIVLNSHAACPVHARAGYVQHKMQVVPNGFDVDQFCPSDTARRRIRCEIGVNDAVPLVGLVGRLHPHKDHRTFIQAATRLAHRHPDVHFLLAGDEHTIKQTQVNSWIRQAGLGHRFHCLGVRTDVASVYASLDISVCSSLTEGFPNVVGEAMSCGVPCVATRVGDCPIVVGKTGRIVEAANPASLAEGISDLLQLPRPQLKRLGEQARRRIADNYDIERITDRYAELWHNVSGVAGSVSHVPVSHVKQRLKKPA